MRFIFRHIRLLGCLFLFFALCGFSSCRSRNLVVVFIDNGKNSSAAERLWLEEILGSFPEPESFVFDGGSWNNYSLDEYPVDKNTGVIFIDFFSSWVFEEEPENRPDQMVISKTWFVPLNDSLSGRRNTSLDMCIEGNESLVTIHELRPPFTAIRVDGYAAGDEHYPLIRTGGISLRLREDAKKQETLTASELKDFFENNPSPLINEKPAVTWISAAGDVMLGRNAGNILLNEGAQALFGGTSKILAESDLSLVNLEGALSSRGSKAQKTFTFRFEPPGALSYALRDAGIGAVLFANNHTFDYGVTAFLDSLDYLEKAGIAFLGVGRNEEEALRPFIFEKGNFRARLWGLASFPRERSGWDGLQNIAGADKAGYIHAGRGGAEKLKAVFSEYDSTGDNGESLNIVLFHGGEEWSHRPNSATRELYTSLAAGGADLIIGSHPHIVQGFEWIGEKLIFWSLGNFVFAGMENTGGGDEGLLIRLGYSGKKLLYIEPFAVNLSGPRVELAPNQEQKLEDFYRKSKELARK